jgi:hypothetical protein
MKNPRQSQEEVHRLIVKTIHSYSNFAPPLDDQII